MEATFEHDNGSVFFVRVPKSETIEPFIIMSAYDTTVEGSRDMRDRLNELSKTLHGLGISNEVIYSAISDYLGNRGYYCMIIQY